MLIDLHTHTFFSDGVLIPAELIRRYEVNQCAYLGITDHVDQSNIDFVVPRIVEIAKKYAGKCDMHVFPGCEITHVLPDAFESLVLRARSLGAKIVVAHGETPVEPVIKGTNKAALCAGVDILAHPGFITDDDAMLAAEKGVFLEITARGGHSLTNGHVCQVAKKCGAQVIFSTDSHVPGDLATCARADAVLRGAGFTEKEVQAIWHRAEQFCEALKGV